MSQQLFIPILLGTVREGRQSEKVATIILEYIANKYPTIQTQLFDPRTMNIPQDDEGTSLRDANPEWRDAMSRADGLIIVTPEYNHGYPGSLKRALDVLLEEYIHKAVGLVGVSASSFGGVRAIEALTPVVRELGLSVTFTDLYFPKVMDMLAEDGSLNDEGVHKRIDGFLTELSWMAMTLRWGRNNLASKYGK